MIPKPKHTPMSQHGWKQLPFRRRLDIWVSSWCPGWIIGLVVSMAFSLIFTIGITSVIALAAWDLSWYWGVTSRAIFGGLTALFSLIVWSNT